MEIGLWKCGLYLHTIAYNLFYGKHIEKSSAKRIFSAVGKSIYINIVLYFSFQRNRLENIVYDFKWYLLATKQQILLARVLHRIQNSPVFTIRPFIDLDFETAANVWYKINFYDLNENVRLFFLFFKAHQKFIQVFYGSDEFYGLIAVKDKFYTLQSIKSQQHIFT